VRWGVIFCTFVVAAVSYLDRNNISIAASSLQKEFALTNVQLGTVFSSFIMGYAFTQPLAGRIADRFGASRVIAVAILWWSVFTALLPAVPPGITGAMAVLLGVRFLLGIGEAIIFPASNRLVAEWIPSRERGLANGLIFCGVGVGAGFAPPLITYIMLRHGWRISFLVCAVLGLIVGLVWYLLARNTPEEHSRVSPNELAKIKAGLPESHSAEIPRLVPWRLMLRSKEVLAITISYFTYGYVAWIFFSWFYIYLLEAHGLNLKASAVYSMLPFIAMAICSSLGGLLSDALAKSKGPRVGRSFVAVFGMMLAAVFLIVGSRAGNINVAVVVLAGGAGALYLSQSSFWSVTADIGGKSSGSVSGFMNMGNQFGAMITASLTPWIASRFGWTSAFLVAAALSVLGALAWLFVDPRERLDTIAP